MVRQAISTLWRVLTDRIFLLASFHAFRLNAVVETLMLVIPMREKVGILIAGPPPRGPTGVDRQKRNKYERSYHGLTARFHFNLREKTFSAVAPPLYD